MIDHSGGTFGSVVHVFSSAPASALAPVFSKSVTRTNRPSGDCASASMAGRASASDRLYSPFSISARANASRAVRVRRIELDDAAEHLKGGLRLALKRVDLGQRQMRADEPRLEANRLLEEDGALGELLLLDADRAEHRVGDGTCLGIGKRQAGLLIGFFEAALLHEHGRFLKGERLWVGPLRREARSEKRGTAHRDALARADGIAVMPAPGNHPTTSLS